MDSKSKRKMMTSASDPTNSNCDDVNSSVNISSVSNATDENTLPPVLRSAEASVVKKRKRNRETNGRETEEIVKKFP